MKNDQPRYFFALCSGTIVIILVMVSKFLGLWQNWELNLLDRAMLISPAEPTDDRIVIIGIDEDDIRKVGYPIPDGTLAQLLTELQTYQPRGIGIDIFRDLPVPPGTTELRSVLKTTPQIIGIEKSVLPDPENPTVDAPPDLPPDRVGFADILIDKDSKVRRALLSGEGFDGNYRFSLATRLAVKYLEQEGITLENGQRDQNAFQFNQVEIPRFTGNNGGYVRADSGGNQVLVNWRRGTKFHRISLQQFRSRAFSADLLKNKIILIGYTAPFSAKDTFSAPGIQTTEIFGVEYHAHTISQIVSGVLNDRPFLRTLPSPLEYGLILLWGSLGIIWALVCPFPWQMYGGLIGGGVLLVAVNGGLIMLHWWLPIVPSLVVWASSALVTRNINDFRSFLAQQQALLVQRQQTLDDAFNAMHNGPLHTLGEMLSLLKMAELPPESMFTKLEQLDRELRTVYEALRPENLEKTALIPLHELLYEVYHRTMQRDFSCFRALKVKMPDIHPINDRGLSGELKRELCDFLEESLCNVGKHATGATRLIVSCKEIAGKRSIRVVDNGIGLPSDTTKVSGGTKHAHQLAKQLRGKFQRHSNTPKGTICELEW